MISSQMGESTEASWIGGSWGEPGADRFLVLPTPKTKMIGWENYCMYLNWKM